MSNWYVLAESNQGRGANVTEQLKMLGHVQKGLESVGSKGYLNNLDLTSFSVVGKILPFCFNQTNGIEALQIINGAKSKESYKWLYNILLLSLYHLCVSSIGQINDELDEDLVSELLAQERIFFAKIDPSIRQPMRKKRNKHDKNTYVGFDTEFNNAEIGKNSLVSAQLAITSKISVKLPKTPRYTISHLDIEKNQLQKVRTNSDIFNYEKVEGTIQWCLQKIQQIQNGKYE
jgi:hypothetical protein